MDKTPQNMYVSRVSEMQGSASSPTARLLSRLNTQFQQYEDMTNTDNDASQFEGAGQQDTLLEALRQFIS